MRHSVAALFRVEDDIPRADPLRAEKRLCAAVLAQALKDTLATYEGDSEIRKNIAIYKVVHATDWILASDKTPGSYEWVCKALNIDPAWITTWLLGVLPGLSNKQKQEISFELSLILLAE